MPENDEIVANGSGPNGFVAAGNGSPDSDLVSEIDGIMRSGKFRNMRDFRVQNPLPDVDQSLLDDTVTRVGPVNLTITNDMIQAGMFKSIPNWIGVPSVKRRKSGRAGAAKRSMVPETRGERWRLDQGSDTWPLYVTWDHFDFDIREEAHAQRLGENLDTSHEENAIINVNTAIEEQTIFGLTDKDGSVMKIDGLSAPGLLSAGTVATYSTWTGLTGAQILTIVRGMLDTQRTKKKYGAQTFYYPGNYQSKLMDEFTTGYPKSILQRLQELEFNNQPVKFKVAESLPDDSTILLEMSRNTAQVALGQQAVPISWTTPPGWRRYSMIVAAMVTMVFADYDGNYGVVVGGLA